jgi:hypothetical protein
MSENLDDTPEAIRGSGRFGATMTKGIQSSNRSHFNTHGNQYGSKKQPEFKSKKGNEDVDKLQKQRVKMEEDIKANTKNPSDSGSTLDEFLGSGLTQKLQDLLKLGKALKVQELLKKLQEAKSGEGADIL